MQENAIYLMRIARGDLRTATAALGALREALPSLVISDRAYFRGIWNEGRPIELLALEPPPQRGTRRAAHSSRVTQP